MSEGGGEFADDKTIFVAAYSEGYSDAFNFQQTLYLSLLPQFTPLDKHIHTILVVELLPELAKGIESP